MHLLKLIHKIVPISNPEWNRVQDKHSEKYGDKEKMVELLKHRFQHMVRQKVPTSDPNCPEHIQFTKRAYQKIIHATNGSTGGSGTASDDLFTNREVSESYVDLEDNKVGEYAEQGNVLGGNDSTTPSTTLLRSVNINDSNADADGESGGVEDVLNTSISTEFFHW